MSEERRLVTVLFADAVGSTGLGEMLDPEDVRALLGRYFAIAREVVEEHGGTLEKFIGDAVMAVFGLPMAHGDDAARALAAALELRDRVKADPHLGGRLPIRLGVNSGEVVASREPASADFLVTGDPVNVAARLQQAAEPWAILVGERAARAAGDGFVLRPIDPVAVRGKALPVSARELIGRVAVARTTRTTLVGREADLAQLELVATRAFRERRPFLVSVIAAPGVGKSRLLEEFIDRLPSLSPDAQVAIAQCLPYGQRLTYWPLRALLIGILGLPDETPPDVVRSAVHVWLAERGDETPDRTADLLAATIGAADLDLVDRAELFAAWRSTIELAAIRHPLILVIEDLHWSSDSLLDLVEFVLQPRSESALLMIALARPELLDRRAGWGGGRRNYVSLALEPLDDGEVGDLVRQLLDGPAPDFVRSVVARAEGNPFYAGEIIRSILDRVPDLRDNAAVERALAALPDTVQATVLARLDVLSPSARRILQVGSVFGRSYRLSGVASLDPELRDHLVETSDELLDRDLIRTSGRELFTFRHILIREVAYGTLTRTERIRLHAAAGEWIESTAGSDADALAELIAYHYREAIVLARLVGQPIDDASRRRAASWLRHAAEAAWAGAAAVEAARHLQAAIDLADRQDMPELYLRLGQVLLGGDGGIAAFTQAYELGGEFDASADFQLLALALRLTAMTRWFASVARQPSLAEFEELRREARHLFERATEDRARATYLISEAFVPFWLGNLGRKPAPDDIDRARSSGLQGLGIAEALDDALLMSAALDGLGSVTSIVSPREGIALARRRVSFEHRLSLEERLDAHNVLAWKLSDVGDLDDAISISDRGLSAVQPGQDPYFSLAVASWRPYALTLLGRWDEVPGAAERCRQLWMAGGRAAAGYGTSAFIAALQVAQARRDEDGIERWSGVLGEILGQFGEDHPSRRLMSFIEPNAQELATHVIADWQFYVERVQHLERALNACADRRQIVPPGPLDEIVESAGRLGQRPLMAQALRVRGLQSPSGQADLKTALALFREMRAGPYIARVEVELGGLIKERDPVEVGMATLEALGDIDQLDRVRRFP